MIYNICHPINGELNLLCENRKFQYDLVAKIEADSYEDAFKMAQNDFNEQYAALGHRSTSIGDVIQSEEDWSRNVAMLVMPLGFQEVTNKFLSYTKI